jgi:hypothetical protein
VVVSGRGGGGGGADDGDGHGGDEGGWEGEWRTKRTGLAWWNWAKRRTGPVLGWRNGRLLGDALAGHGGEDPGRHVAILPHFHFFSIIRSPCLCLTASFIYRCIAGGPWQQLAARARLDFGVSSVIACFFCAPWSCFSSDPPTRLCPLCCLVAPRLLQFITRPSSIPR